MSQSRNAPCPCGSGKKYKQCHLREDDAKRRVEAAQARAAAAPGDAVLPDEAFETVPLSAVGKAMGALGVVVAIVVGVLTGAGNGIIVGAAWALAYVAWLSFRSPPPPNLQQGNPAGLDFGMSAEKKPAKKR